MPHFVRCIDGHVFDAGMARVCPVCGAVVEFTESVDPTSPGTPIADGTGVAASAMLRAPVLGAVAAGVLCVGIAALFFALRETRPATTNNSVSAPAAASLTTQQLGDPLQMALFVTRMLTAFDQKHYADALSQAEALATNNNPVGMRVKAEILLDGLAGRKDPVQARALLTRAINLGDPSSALSLARLSEQGIGGPQNSSDTRFLYLEAAQGNVPGADAELVRLHPDNARFMTVMQAYRTVMTSAPTAKETLKAASVLTGLSQGGSTPATCLSAWLIPKYLANGWVVADNFKGSPQGESAEAVQYRSFSYGADRADPWCEWGMAMLAAKGIPGHPKDLVTANVFYRLAVMNSQLGSSLDQAKQELAAVEGQMTPAEKAQADNLLSGVVDDILAAAPANSAAAPAPAAAAGNSEANSNTAPPAAAPVPQIDIGDAIASALKVAQVNALYRQGNYGQTADLARELAAENNPLGAYALGVMLKSGTIGTQDLAAARKQFVTSARLGDSFGALEAARMLEQGAGGPQDIDGAKAFYLFAARSGNADADAALARLNMSDQRGLTIFQANDNLIAGKDIDESWKRINEMIAAHSAPAMCLAGWLYGGGHSTPRDFQQALELLHAGSKTNYPTCTWGLSRMVSSGLPNLPRSLVQADVLLHLTEGGVSQERLPTVKSEIAELEKQMSDTDKAKAETMLQNGTVQDAAKN